MSEVKRRLETDLAAIRSAIASGQLEDAERMLAGVPLNVSPGTEFSKEIGDLYLQVALPAMAGRYWYLLENKSEQMLVACETFERSLANNPVLILQAIGWCPDASQNAKAKLKALHEAARDFRRKYQYHVEPPRGWRDRIALLGCGIIGVVVMFIFVMGIVFIINTF